MVVERRVGVGSVRVVLRRDLERISWGCVVFDKVIGGQSEM
jgi:hypothetical protein